MEKEALLPDVAPQLATAAEAPPAGPGWIHEIKYDGYRLLCRIEGGRARLISRSGKDWSARFEVVVAAAESLPVRNAILDGEVAVVDADGRTRFQGLQNLGGGEPRDGVLRYFAFDLLYRDGSDLMAEPLIARKAALASLLSEGDWPVLHYSDHVEGNGASFYRQACAYGLEGIISKKRDAAYRPGRSRDWLKIKCFAVDEFVVGGFTEPSGSRHGFGALLIGGHDSDGRLRFAGRAGTGFTDAQLREFAKRLRDLEIDDSPFFDGPEGRAARGMHWVDPVLVAEVAYAEFTNEGLVRHPSFRGFRDDKEASDVSHPLLGGDEGDGKDGDGGDGTAGEAETAGTTGTAGEAGTVGTAGDAGGGMVGGGDPKKVSKAAQDKAANETGRRSAGRESDPPRRSRRSRRAGSASDGPLEVEGIAISNPDKVLYPDAGVTKRELVEYYARIAPWMLPRVTDRPLTLVRCPNGIADCFYQKHLEGTVPDAIRAVPVKENDAQAVYGAIDSAAGLVALAQLGVLEIHTWGSKRDDLERPDRFTLDFDPDPKLPWIRVVEAVLETRGLLGEMGLQSFLKTTGGKGLHVVVPIEPDMDWTGIKEFSRAVGETVARDNPGRFTLSVSKDRRRGRILIDYLRNGRGATAIETYSTRARPGAPVAVPIRWEELADGIRGDSFDIRNTLERIDRLEDDPWSDYGRASRQRITAAMKKRVGMSD